MIWQILAAAAVAAVVPLAVPAPQEQPTVDTVTAANDAYRRMTVAVTIKGTGPYRFMIDTGAQATVLSHALAARLALTDFRPAVLVGAASRQDVMTAAVDGIELGSRSINVPRAPLVASENIGGADGILGLDTLQGQRVLIDFKGKAIHVARARDLGGNRGFEIVVKAREQLGQLIITQAWLDGVDVSVIVDTGAQGTTGNQALFDRLRHRQQLGEATLTDVNGVSMTGRVHVARELRIDRAGLQNLPILFTESPTFVALGLNGKPALILGMDQLRSFNRVAIDFETRRVLFDVPANVSNSLTLFSAETR